MLSWLLEIGYFLSGVCSDIIVTYLSLGSHIAQLYVKVGQKDIELLSTGVTQDSHAGRPLSGRLASFSTV